ncbi:MAG: hypothetical protein OQJ84_04225 [Xanthomonadales bacterium]|nr:hypothetical protein [Xanthomonadales bacterium]
MLKKYGVNDAHLTQQAADELIGYLYLLIDELLEKYSHPLLEEQVEESLSEKPSCIDERHF